MLSLTCPKCGVVYPVPLDRIGAPLRCRRCEARFYMDSSGQVSMGKPPKATAVADPFQKSEVGPEFDPIGMLGKIPKPIRIVATAVAVVLMSVGLYRWIMGLGNRPPDTLNDRAVYVATAFAENDLERLRTISAPGTTDDLMKWYEKLRPQLGDRDKPIDVAVLIKILGKSLGKRGGGNATVQATLVPPSAIQNAPAGEASKDSDLPERGPGAQPKANPFPSFDLMLFWIADDQGQWLLDGSANLKNLESRRPRRTDAAADNGAD